MRYRLNLSCCLTIRLLGFVRNAAVSLDRFEKRLVSLFSFGFSDLAASRPPQLFDHLHTPQGAVTRSTHGLAAYQHVDGVGVQLGEIPECHPTALLNGHLEHNSMGVTVSGNSLGV